MLSKGLKFHHELLLLLLFISPSGVASGNKNKAIGNAFQRFRKPGCFRELSDRRRGELWVFTKSPAQDLSRQKPRSPSGAASCTEGPPPPPGRTSVPLTSISRKPTPNLLKYMEGVSATDVGPLCAAVHVKRLACAGQATFNTFSVR